ncbi:MAG: hypothetical protein QE271_14795 [Bacteriovoracaceae bacterium]|nr:hypothetical protein [Bacteriovoracaceae bacterium]
MKTVMIIGAGQLGSRHLQGLAKIGMPLNILVIDPDSNSINLSKDRYQEINNSIHQIEFLNAIPNEMPPIDVAIVACSSHVRFSVVKALLAKTKVRFLVLEKLLFNKREEYDLMEAVLKNTNTKVFVNCSMRMMPIYVYAKEILKSSVVKASISGSQFGLVTNSIHYLDYLVYLSNSHEFRLDTSQLDFPSIVSKRAGFKELNGTLKALFDNGSRIEINCYPKGKMPIIVQLESDSARIICKESEGRAWISTEENGWIWEEIEAKIPFQSQLTTELVNTLLNEGASKLVTFQESSSTHLQLLEGLKSFLIEHGDTNHEYPFT